MDLYIIRHADAVPLGEGGISEDADRPLTETGKGHARALAAAFLKRGVQPAVVVTSPLVRARQTAEELLRNWPAPAPSLQESELLSPGFKFKKLSRFLRELGASPIAIVGHMPDLNIYAAWLIGGKNAHIDLAKASVAHIACNEGPGKDCGALGWLVTPEWYV